MNRINRLLQAKQQDIQSVYFCAGHPTLQSTVPTLQALVRSGIDMVEIGVPFSDPIADGPVIQQAATTALQGGMTLRLLLSQLHNIRRGLDQGGIGDDTPLLLMGYLNPLLHYGLDTLCQQCEDIGIDGLIIPDLPFDDYLHTLRPIAQAHGLRIVMLITPETSDQRIRLIDQHTDSFIYAVSTPSTTGAKDHFTADTINYFRHIRQLRLRNNHLIGFGISNPQTFNTARQHAAGTIIGSQFVQLLQDTQDPEQAIQLLLRKIGASPHPIGREGDS